MLERLLKESVAEREGWIDSERVLRELEDHRSGKRDNHTRLWLILWLQLWFRVVVTGELDYHADLSEFCGRLDCRGTWEVDCNVAHKQI